MAENGPFIPYCSAVARHLPLPADRMASQTYLPAGVSDSALAAASENAESIENSKDEATKTASTIDKGLHVAASSGS